MTIGEGFNLDENESETDAYAVNKKSYDVDRKQMPSDVSDFVSGRSGVRRWSTDPNTLKDYGDEPLVRVVIDVIAKAVAGQDYHVKDLDTDEVSEEAKQEVNRLHRQDSFREVREKIGREIGNTGNAFIIKQYSGDTVENILVPPSETMFIVTNDKGYVDGYVQKRGTKQPEVFDADEVIHIPWGSAAGKYYGVSPVENAKETIETISELYEKEIIDLREGEQSGLVSIQDTRMTGKDIREFGQELNSNEGERHKVSVVDGNVEYVDFSSNYSDMEILDRYRFHLRALASAYRVSPTFIGFDIGEGGIGQGRAREEDRENQKQAVNIIVNQIQDKLNRDLMPDLLDGNYKIEFDTKDKDDETDVSYYKQLGDAINSLSEAGVELSIEDDAIVVADGQTINQEQMDELSSKRGMIEMLSNQLDKDQVKELVDDTKDFDSCVESVMAENPNMSKEDAEAICASKKDEDEKDLDQLSSRKKDLVEATDSDGFREAISKVDDIHSSRTKAIEHTRELLDGSLSNSTYYDWLSDAGLD